MQRDPVGYTAGINLYTYCSNNPVNWVDPRGLDKQGNKGNFPGGDMIPPGTTPDDPRPKDPTPGEPAQESWWEWYLYESVLPGPYGQPMSEWGPQGPTGWGDPMKYTEQAGGWWKWGERAAVGISAGAAISALGLGIAEMAGLINTAPQANNIIRIISKVGRWGFRLDKAEISPPKPIHPHFWRW